MTARAGGSDWQYAGVVTEKEAKVLHECVPGERQHDDLLELGAAVELRRDVAVLRQHVSVRRLHKQQQRRARGAKVLASLWGWGGGATENTVTRHNTCTLHVNC